MKFKCIRLCSGFLPRASHKKSPLGKTLRLDRLLISSAWASIDSLVFDIAREKSFENFSNRGRHSSFTRRECSTSRTLSVNLAFWRPKTQYQFWIRNLVIFYLLKHHMCNCIEKRNGLSCSFLSLNHIASCKEMLPNCTC